MDSVFAKMLARRHSVLKSEEGKSWLSDGGGVLSHTPGPLVALPYFVSETFHCYLEIPRVFLYLPVDTLSLDLCLSCCVFRASFNTKVQVLNQGNHSTFICSDITSHYFPHLLLLFLLFLYYNFIVIFWVISSESISFCVQWSNFTHWVYLFNNIYISFLIFLFGMFLWFTVILISEDFFPS